MKNTAMKEVVGSCGILVDPYNTEEISSAIEGLLSDTGLRNILAQKGLERSREFNWRKTAEDTLSLYREAIGE